MKLFYTFVILVTVLAATRINAEYAIDVSSGNSAEITSSQWSCLAGINQRVIIQIWAGGYGINSHIASVVQAAQSAGFENVDLYAFLCSECSGNSDASNVVQYIVDTLRQSNVNFGTLWFDIEQCTGCWDTDLSLNQEYIIEAVKTATSLGINVGIYSSLGEWPQTLGSFSGFSQLPQWYAHYDNSSSFSDPSYYSYGGWTSPFMKQYLGNTYQCGVYVDLDYYEGGSSNSSSDSDSYSSSSDSNSSASSDSSSSSNSGSDSGSSDSSSSYSSDSSNSYSSDSSNSYSSDSSYSYSSDSSNSYSSDSSSSDSSFEESDRKLPIPVNDAPPYIWTGKVLYAPEDEVTTGAAEQKARVPVNDAPPYIWTGKVLYTPNEEVTTGATEQRARVPVNDAPPYIWTGKVLYAPNEEVTTGATEQRARVPVNDAPPYIWTGKVLYTPENEVTTGATQQRLPVNDAPPYIWTGKVLYTPEDEVTTGATEQKARVPVNDAPPYIWTGKVLYTPEDESKATTGGSFSKSQM